MEQLNLFRTTLAASLIGGTFLLSQCGEPNKKTEEAAPLKVSVQPVQVTSRIVKLTYSGSIEPETSAEVGFAVPGIVNQVAVEEGQLVHKGQLLAAIDATEYNNALTIANAGLEQAKDMYRRLEDLYKKGSLPEKDFIDIKTKVAQAEANRSINAKHITDSRLVSPLSGIITTKRAVEGSTAGPGIPAFTIIKTDVVYAQLSIPESEIGELQQGMDAVVFIPTLNDSVKGRVVIINPQAEKTSRTYTVKIRLNNAGQRLLPGMIVNVSLSRSQAREITVVPATAVFKDADELTYVYIAGEGRKAIRRRVTTGLLSGSQEVIIDAGLGKGDVIITEGITNLKDGSAISY
ncbi:efflux RND transporter periplasmic adaptor subunit [Niastella sp. OAS944]|uniref:efflux RND transporter periplasmic adaptor subunit n=1 Tax=Niastella sp. OAS944 TaxID=2664089 RepID=UPI003486D186|nr:RND family efflux transporter MFP subunit [Chitinophagaceae bacterium OAS944]